MKIGLHTLKDCSSCNVEVCALGKASPRRCCSLTTSSLTPPPPVAAVDQHPLALLLRCLAAASPCWGQTIPPHRRPGKPCSSPRLHACTCSRHAFQFRVQDTCYELMFRVAAFGIDKKTATSFIDYLKQFGILTGVIDWPHSFLPSHRREHKRQIPNATTVKWTCSHLIKLLHLLKITVHTLGQYGLLQVRRCRRSMLPAV